MNWNVTSTGTVVGEPAFDGDILRLSVLAVEKYLDADDVLQRKNLMFHLAHRGKGAQEVAGRLAPSTRIAFEGFFSGPTFVKNEARPTQLSVNGPVIHFTPEGEAFTSLNTSATAIRVIGEPVKNLGDFEDLTTVVIWGFLGREPEQRYTPAGRLVTQVSIASNRFYYQGEGEDRVKYDVTTWWRVALWGDGGNTAMQHWTKGKGIIFKGLPYVNNETGAPNIWQTSAGEYRASYELNAQRWTFAPARRGDGGGYQARDEDYQAPDKGYEDDDIPF
jgi:single-strand DNA-binding protein